MSKIIRRSCDIIFEALLHAFFLVYFGSLDQCSGQKLDPDSALPTIVPPLVWLLTFLKLETKKVHYQTPTFPSLCSLSDWLLWIRYGPDDCVTVNLHCL